MNSHSTLGVAGVFYICSVWFCLSHQFLSRVYERHLWLITVRPCHMPLAVICILFYIETCRSWLICVSDWMTYGGYLTTDTELYVNSVLGLLQWILWQDCCVTNTPDSKVHGANMGPTWGRQDPGVPHVGHVKLAVWDSLPGFDTSIESAGHITYHIFVVNIQHQSSWIMWAQNIKCNKSGRFKSDWFNKYWNLSTLFSFWCSLDCTSVSVQVNLLPKQEFGNLPWLVTFKFPKSYHALQWNLLKMNWVTLWGWHSKTNYNII